MTFGRCGTAGAGAGVCPKAEQDSQSKTEAANQRQEATAHLRPRILASLNLEKLGPVVRSDCYCVPPVDIYLRHSCYEIRTKPKTGQSVFTPLTTARKKIAERHACRGNQRSRDATPYLSLLQFVVCSQLS